MAATIKDIAKKVGMSTSTVSRALTDDPHILNDTKQKIIKAADELGYKRNFNASSLVTGGSHSIGIIFPSKSRYQNNPFYLEIISGIYEELLKKGFVATIALADSTEQIMKIVDTMVQQAGISKFIFLYFERNDQIRNYLKKQQIDYVTIGNDPDEKGVFIDNDNVHFGQLAGQKIQKYFGANNIIFLQSDNKLRFEEERLAGVRDEFNHVGGSTIKILKVDLKQPTKALKVIQTGLSADVNGIVAAQDELGEFAYQLCLYSHNPIPIVTFNNSLHGLPDQENIYSFDLKPRKIGQVSVHELFEETNFGKKSVVLVK